MEMTGEILSNMIISAANNLGNHQNEIDQLNVFPVPDGDTGKNMFLTMSGAAQTARDVQEAEPLTLADIPRHFKGAFSGGQFYRQRLGEGLAACFRHRVSSGHEAYGRNYINRRAGMRLRRLHLF